MSGSRLWARAMADLCAIQTDLAMCPERLLTPEEIDKLPDLEYLVEGVLPEKSVCVLYGEPSSGKTFVALSLALACANGQPWIGRKTRPARILYVAAEGVLGMKYRLRAYRQRNEIAPDAVQFYAASLQITNLAAVQLLLSDLKAAEFEPDLIILDTLARVSVGKDENSAKDMGEIVAGIEALRREHNAAVLVIHHTRKDGMSERGSSALRGAADVMIECQKSDFENLVVLKCSKMKDDEPFPDLEIGLEKIDLGNGRSSLVAGAPPPLLGRTLKLRPSSAQDQHCERISQILTNKFSQSSASHGEIKRAYCEETKMSDSTFNRALRDLLNSGRVRRDGKGRGARYFPVGVSVNSVSGGCHDTAQIGVKSPPFLGG
jgi:AAA domain